MLNNYLKTLLLFVAIVTAVCNPLAPVLAASPSPQLVKCVDSADVYYVNTEYTDTLNIIANEVVFLAHGFSWSDIVTVPCEQIETSRIFYHFFPEGKLLKFAGSPEVYERRLFCNTRSLSCTDFYYHLPDEATAVSFIGDDWQQRIVEVPAQFKDLLSLRGFVSGLTVPYSNDAWSLL